VQEIVEQLASLADHGQDAHAIFNNARDYAAKAARRILQALGQPHVDPWCLPLAAGVATPSLRA
jgi:hypothetical protein